MDILDAYDLIERAIDSGKVPGGYLISGDVAGNCLDLVRMLLKKLYPGGEKLIEARSHPDIAILEPEGKSRTIKVADMKERIVEPMATTAYSGGWKAGVIVSADRMQLAAANAFLKSLEEPTPKTVYFLLTDRPDSILPTVISRCQLVTLDRPKSVLEGKNAKTIAELLDTAKGGGFFEKSRAGKALAALLKEIKDAVEDDTDVPIARKKFYNTIMLHAREWMLKGTVPRHFAFRNIEAVEEAYARSEKYLPDEAVLTYMMDKFVLPAK